MRNMYGYIFWQTRARFGIDTLWQTRKIIDILEKHVKLFIFYD
jgi:hypothetical protein